MNCPKINPEKKIYLPLKIHNGKRYLPLAAMLDTGSELNVIQKGFLSKLLLNLQLDFSLIKPFPSKIAGFTNDEVKTIGMIQLQSTLLQGKRLKTLEFVIIDDIEGSANPVILKGEVLKLFNLSLSHVKLDNSSPAQLYCDNGNQNLPVLTMNFLDKELYIASKFCKLKPGANQVELNVPLAAPFVCQASKVLATDDFVKNHHDVFITPSTSDLTYDKNQFCSKITVSVFNNSPKWIATEVLADLSSVADDEIKPFSKENWKEITSLRYLQELRLPAKKKDSLFVGKVKDFTVKTQHKVCNINVIFPEGDFASNNQAINNDTATTEKSLSEERFHIKESDNKAFNFEPDNIINLGIQESSDEELEKGFEYKNCIELPTEQQLLLTPEAIIRELPVDQEIKPYVEKIFLQHPKIVSLHSMDVGNLSRTLGPYRLRLRPAALLPQHRKLYHLSPLESSQLREILNFMIKNGTAEKVDQGGGTFEKFASASYILQKSNPNSSPRLIIDYSALNRILFFESVTLPTIDSILQTLSGYDLFTVTDICSAFNSISICKESQELSTFMTAYGPFRLTCLPTGFHSAPDILMRYLDKVVNYIPVRDENGKIKYDDKGYPIMTHSPLVGVLCYFDDIIMMTKMEKTFEASLEKHFDLVKKLVERLDFHSVKINLNKTKFCKSYISFLGWNIGNRFVIADPKRVNKLKDANFPTSQKDLRSFLGLINSLRTSLGFEVLAEAMTLASLTSSKLVKFEPTEEHFKAFEKLKEKLCSAPIYSKLVVPQAPKIVFSDASGGSESYFSSLLAQIVPAKTGGNYVPPELFLNDKNHRLVFDEKLPIKPLPLMKANEHRTDYARRIELPDPPEISYIDEKFYGYSQEDAKYSLEHCLFIEFSLCKSNPDPKNRLVALGQKVCQKLKTTILRAQLLDFEFNFNKTEMQKFLEEFNKGRFPLDKHFLVLDAVAECLKRPLWVFSGYESDKNARIRRFNIGKETVPLVIFLYNSEIGHICRPAILDKTNEISLDKFRGSFEIIAFNNRKVPESMVNRSILELELLALLHSLHAFRKFIIGSELLAIVDSKSLYYIFCKSVIESSTKLNRWREKITQTFPFIKLAFIRSERNLADFLTRNYRIPQSHISKIKLPKFVSNELHDFVPEGKIFTLTEWQSFVESNPQFLTYDNDIQKNDEAVFTLQSISTKELKSASRNIHMFYDPLKSLENSLNHEILEKEQKLEFPDIFNQIVRSNNDQCEVDNETYKLISGKIFINKDNVWKVLLPSKLVPMAIAYSHLASGHAGEKRVQANLCKYFSPLITIQSRSFCRSCFVCVLNNKAPKLQKLSYFPIPKSPWEVVCIDYAENLPTSAGFKHLMLCTCLYTKCTQMYALKDKSTSQFLQKFLEGPFQAFKTTKILTDNAKQFLQKDALVFLAAIGVQVFLTSSFHPAAKPAESFIKIFKGKLKKMLTHGRQENWSAYPSVLTLSYNTSMLPDLQVSPFSLIFGEGRISSNYLNDLAEIPTLHPNILSKREEVVNLNKNIQKISNHVQDKMTEVKLQRNTRLNSTRINKEFSENQIIFCLNRETRKGSTLPLKTVFHPSPYRVIVVKKTTLIVERLIDGHTKVISKDHCKKFAELDKTFSELPEEVLKVCQKRLEDWDVNDLRQLQITEDFPAPKLSKEEKSELDTLIAEREMGFDLPDLEEVDLFDNYPESKSVNFLPAVSDKENELEQQSA